MTVTPPPLPRSGNPGGEHGPGDGAATVPAARAAAPGATAGAAPASRAFLARATLVTVALSLAGSVLGLVRDQALARLFGAGSDTDAFLVAWTVPEFAATLLIEDGLAFALIPAFSAALARRARGAPGDPVRSLVTATLPRLAFGFLAVAALVIGAAPRLVRVLAPGLPDPGLAADCTRLTATCVLSFGLAGYCSAVLRAHRRFLAPAAIYVAYNAGIVAAMFGLGGGWGVRAAAAGVAVGGLLMVAVQLPALWRQLRHRPRVRAVGDTAAGAVVGSGAVVGAPAGTGTGTATGVSSEAAAGPGGPMDFALVASVLLFALCRQSQVLIERFLASSLPAGAISHLNYAQKVAQIPMALSLMLCTVTFPVVARALADGDTERARSRVERDLALVFFVVLLGTAAVIACAPQLTELLFQRGAFTADDTAATAAVMRVYALGLLGQALVGVLVRSYFSHGRPAWYPVGAMAAGIVVTSWTGAAVVGPWGVAGIAAANAAGITVTAALLLAGTREREARPAGAGGGPARAARGVPVRLRRVLAELSRPLRAAVVATAAGAFAASRPQSAQAGLVAGCVTVAAVHFLVAHALGAQGTDPVLRCARTVTRRLRHGLSR
ncbi:lipid II flippase MurJ [Streptomyces sp. NPDC047017]|uniref:murein biosynthesis integral membrane protein MurJ n=1 Tax=Streptomyces sp. NPDC047017 TaxID=3155024 RepID=UPI0033EC3D5B